MNWKLNSNNRMVALRDFIVGNRMISKDLFGATVDKSYISQDSWISSFYHVSDSEIYNSFITSDKSSAIHKSRIKCMHIRSCNMSNINIYKRDDIFTWMKDVHDHVIFRIDEKLNIVLQHPNSNKTFTTNLTHKSLFPPNTYIGKISKSNDKIQLVWNVEEKRPSTLAQDGEWVTLPTVEKLI